MVPLTGGVASDIWKVQGPDRAFVVKRALARLRVAQEWNAPVSRNATEVLWLLEAAKLVPQAVPKVLAHDAAYGAFAMEYLDPASHPVWKGQLLRGHVDVSFAAAVGTTIAKIHGGTAHSQAVAERFATGDAFHALRLEPYLEATARAHPDLSGPVMSLSAETLSAKLALVHGDVSPKNILAGPRGPVILDAECAWYGEPAFDLAFCLNHLLLKGLIVPAARQILRESFGAMVAAYLAQVDWEPAINIERRTARLLPALLLARVDGKSPVEYIATEEQKNVVRRVAALLLRLPPDTLAHVASTWNEELCR
jgi:5-methylthioribose kinase